MYPFISLSTVPHLTRTYYTSSALSFLLLQLEFPFPYTATKNYDTVDITCALCDIRIVAIVIKKTELVVRKFHILHFTFHDHCHLMAPDKEF